MRFATARLTVRKARCHGPVENGLDQGSRRDFVHLNNLFKIIFN